jgi:hypothetical protein
VQCTGSDTLLATPDTLRSGSTGTSLGLRVLSLDRSGLLITWALGVSSADPAAAERYAEEARSAAAHRAAGGARGARRTRAGGASASGAGDQEEEEGEEGDSGPLVLTSADGRFGSAGVPTSLRLTWTSAVDTCAGLPRPLSLLGGEDGWGLSAGGVAMAKTSFAELTDRQAGTDGGLGDLLMNDGPLASLGDIALGSSSVLSLWESGDRVTCGSILTAAAGSGGDVLVGTADGAVSVLTAGGDAKAITMRPAEPRQSREGAALWAGMPATLGGGAVEDDDEDADAASVMSAAVAAASARGLGSDAVSLTVTAVAASMLPPHAILTAMSDGSVSLHGSVSPNPAVTWPDVAPAGHAISSLAWSPTRPAVFFTLDTAGVLRGWDLLQSSAGPSAAVSALREAGVRAKLGSGLDGLLRLGGTASASASAPASKIDAATAKAGSLTRPVVCVDISGSAVLVALPGGVGAGRMPLSERWAVSDGGEEEQRAVASLTG